MLPDTPIQHYLTELCEEQRTSGRSTSQTAAEFIQELTWLDMQAKYLAEEICLDSANADGLPDRATNLLNHYLKNSFPTDQAKNDALERLCHAAHTNRGSANSDDLFNLLTAESQTIAQASPEKPSPLQEMKDVKAPTRFGDIVFLPPNAEIIVIGDTHGDLASTQQIIDEIEKSQAISRGVIIIFLGDYVHNGLKNWQNLHQVLKLQQAHPRSVILLSGNHESRETYLTALKEHFHIHWRRFTPAQLPVRLRNRNPQADNHYGHMRFDLIRSFGFVEGEKIYSAFTDWGMRLPYICISDKLMISHSIGKVAGTSLQLSDLIKAKQQDAETIRHIGYQAWNARRQTSHAALVNNRTITRDLLDAFGATLQVNQFVVGHCHYRSGDTIQLGNKTLTTVVSSHPYSPDSGHYMYYEMVVKRAEKRGEEALAGGRAFACYLSFTTAPDRTRKMTISRL